MSPIDIVIRALLEDKGFQQALKSQKELKDASTSASKETKAGMESAAKAAQTLEKETRKVADSFGEMGDAIKQGIGIDIGRRITDGLLEAAKAGVQFNATVEQQTIAFESLLKSASAAQERVAMLYDFAATTPFEFEEVMQSDRVLQSLTRGALAGAEGLRMVGDTAADVARPLRDVDMWMGRVYAGLRSGTPIGEATLRLIEMGAISGDTARKLNEMAEKGTAMTNTMEVMQQSFGHHAGAMEKQSKTLNGQLSTMRDNFKQLAGTGAAEIFETIKTSVEAINKVIGSSTFQGGFKALIETSGASQLGKAARGAGQLSTQTPNRLDTLGAMGELIGGAAGGSSGDPSSALAGSIATFLNAKRAAGEMDEGDLARLTKKLGLLQQIEDAEKRLQLLKEMAAGLRGAAPKGAAKLSEEDVEAAFLAHIKDQEVEIERYKDFLAIEQQLDEEALAAKEKYEREFKDLEAQHHDVMEDHRRDVMRQTQVDQDALRVKRDELALKRAILDADFRTPENQKRSERMGLLRQEIAALDDLIEKLTKRRDLENDAAAKEALNQQVIGLGDQKRALQVQQVGISGQADPFSFGEQFTKTVTDLQNQWGTAAEQMANSFRDVFNSAISTISNGITGLIMGTQTWGQALLNIGVSILQSIIQAIVTMGVRWVMTQMMMAIAGKAIQASMVAANAPLAAASAAIWATPATLATIASYGAAAAAAPAFITAANASVMASSMVGGFKEGGFTGDGDPNAVAGVAHKGEFYFTAPQTRAIGVGNLQAMARSAGGGGGGGIAAALQGAGGGAAAGGGAEVHVGFLGNDHAVAEFLESGRGRKMIVDVVERKVLEMQQS